MSLWRKNLRNVGVAFCIATTAITVKPAFAQGPPPGDPLTADMFVAITERDPNSLRIVLDKGAKPNEENWLGITALIWAAWSHNEEAVRLLLAHGADVNHQTVFGGPLEAAEMGGSSTIFHLLLDKGAQPSQKRLDKMNVVMMAAQAGHVANLRTLLARKPDLNATDNTGMTALMHAARRGMTETARMLIAAGAKIDLADTYGRTALMYAAQSGDPATIGMLLAKGANPNRRDKTGDTPLVLAARYNGDPEIARLLRSTAKLKDNRGRSPEEIAAARGNTAFAAVLSPAKPRLVAGTSLRPVSQRTPGTTDLAVRARVAVSKSLPLIEKTTATFSQKMACSSCHHQGVGLMTTGAARQYGYKIDNLLAVNQKSIVTGLPESASEDLKKLAPHPEGYRHFPTVDMNEATPAFSTSFVGLAMHDVPPTDALRSIATIVLRLQAADGGWGFGLNRAPLQSSRIAMTAYTLRMLQTYLPAELATERDERTARALQWLAKTPARNGEDRAFRLLALKWANAPQPVIDAALQQLRRAQRTDGGWAQFDSPTEAGPRFARSDAYATGEALYALHVGGGVTAGDETYKRGVTYLLRTQDDDGSWFVSKRAMPANNFLETGFPHGQSQYISYSGTCFATMALMFAAEPAPRPVAIVRRTPVTR